MTNEKNTTPMPGLPMLVLDVILLLAFLPTIIYGGTHNLLPIVAAGIALLIAGALILPGLLVLQPNEASVLLLFGAYVGTVRKSGFFWVNPFYTRKRVSLRLRNLNGDRLKVNDKEGNPVEIAGVVVWQVQDTYEACFEVDDFHNYVAIQSDAALRHLTSRYPYDSWDEHEVISLRANIDEISEAFRIELQERLGKAGVIVHEARLSHLAYAPEIAEAMLKRQQAGAIVAARKRLVEGAVGMVRMALDQLKSEKVVELDDERKAAMVTNLLVVLCGETNAQPVVNAGTLYH